MTHQQRLRQTWPLSQDAHKSSGTCSVCHAIRQIHIKDGTIHRHGPRNNPCTGSHNLPLAVQSNTALITQVTVSSFPSSQSASVSASSMSTTSSIPPVFAHPQPSGGLIKHIPKSARPACATLLSSVLNSIASHSDDLEAWRSLFNFGESILRKPIRTGKRHNLTSIIKKRTTAGEVGLSEVLPFIPALFKKRNADDMLAAAVTAKVEDGNIKAAIRILCSEEKPATDVKTSYEKLLERHPQPPFDRRSAQSPDNVAAIQVTESEVMKSIRSFPAGSSGGPDGVRPQHILDLVNSRESGSALLTSLTAFVNSLLEGKCSPEVKPILFGGQLIALEKKSGGIRPIAIGYTWRRIAAKCANNYATTSLNRYLQPLQLGVGTPGGCEAAVHATRRFVESMPDDHCVVKLDFSNAFNSLHRDVMLDAVLEKVPGIYKFCHLSYSKSSELIYSGYTIHSSEGPQQGDPLGPLLFCNSIHPLLLSLTSLLILAYMDDVTLGGPEAQVARDVEEIRRKGNEIGLILNEKKCEFINKTAISIDPAFLKFTHLRPEDAELLGAPLSTGSAMDTALSCRCDDLARASSRLSSIAAHDALVLLKASFSSPKLLHTMRASPCSGHAALEKFDELLRECVCTITNTDLTDVQWIQASLPVRNGGLGVRRVSSLAPSAFLASAAGTRGLQNMILCKCVAISDSAVDLVLNQWSAAQGQSGVVPPVGSLAAKQQEWDKPFVAADLARLNQSWPDRHHQARLRAVSAPHSGDWLHALPISSCGLRLDDNAVRVAVGLRLGAKLCEPHLCPCGATVNPEGTHGLACRRSAGRSSRHHTLNDLVCRALGRANVPAIKEPGGLTRSDGKRPDGLTQIPWQAGKCMTWDVTVTDTLAESYLHATSSSAGAAAEAAADRKELKYQSLATTHSFIPLAFETLGPINSKGLVFLYELGRRQAAITGDMRETSFLFQRLSLTIQRFNAVCFNGSFCFSNADHDSY